MERLFNVVIVFCVVLSVSTADFRDDALKLHNLHRQKHKAGPFGLSSKLNEYAQKVAQSNADLNKMQHSSGPYGENLFCSSNSKLNDTAAVMQATNLWYGEVSQYNYTKPEFSMETGHFTQVVWVNSKNLGIAIARSNTTGRVYVCASYDPPGNYKGQFTQNVLQP